jgi:hypothetical protein
LPSTEDKKVVRRKLMKMEDFDDDDDADGCWLLMIIFVRPIHN